MKNFGKTLYNSIFKLIVSIPEYSPLYDAICTLRSCKSIPIAFFLNPVSVFNLSFNLIELNSPVIIKVRKDKNK